MAASIAAGALAAGTGLRAARRGPAAFAATPPEGRMLLVGGQRIHAVTRGSGPDLVLLHGANGSLREFTFALMDRLAADYRVTAFDRPGLGWSDAAPDGDPGLDAQARVLRAAAAQLGITRPLVLGQSYGGAVALAWAMQDAPDGAAPSALILVSAVSLPWPGQLDLSYRLTASALGRGILVPLASAWLPPAWLREAVRRVFAPQPVPAGYLEHLGPDLTLRPAAIAENMRQINALRPQLVAMEQHYPQLDLPVEIVHGDADSIVPLPVHSQPLAALLPSARLEVLPGMGHMPHHTAPEAVIDAIARAAGRAGLR